MRGERAQVTLFFAIGIVVLLAVGTITYLLVSRTSAADASAQQRGAREAADAGVLSAYLASCVDTVVDRQLRALGESGGLLDFEGYPSAMLSVGNGSREIGYGITRNRDAAGTGAIGPYAYPAPRYPDNGVAIENATLDPATLRPFAPFQDGYFGDVTFPAVCGKSGMNRPGSAFTCRYYEANPPGTPGRSAQELLEERIAQGVRGCADLRAFTDAIGQQVERVDDPVANVTFTFDNVLVSLTYPVQLRGAQATTLETLRRDYKVRYLPVAQFAIDLAREESRNVTFDISRDFAQVPSYREGFVVRKSGNVSLASVPAGFSGAASLVTILDQHSQIEGETYAFSFLVEHRLPMLSPVPLAEAEDVDATGHLPDGTLVAADPDEGVLSFARTRDGTGRITRLAVRDEDGDQDWQDY